jgi:hypothetical protein
MLIGRATAIIVALTISGLAGAAQAATCYDNAQALSSSAISSFTSNPGGALAGAPQGGGALVAQIRDLAASDSGTLSAITGLLKDANDDQKRAIGSGLAQAAKICLPKDQSYATQIQQSIADSKDSVLQLAYAASAGDQPIGAGAGAGGGSPGASGGATTGLGVPTGAGGGIEGINGNGVNTGQFSFTGSVTGANSVSP